jgi:hypothetical protein
MAEEEASLEHDSVEIIEQWYRITLDLFRGMRKRLVGQKSELIDTYFNICLLLGSCSATTRGG